MAQSSLRAELPSSPAASFNLIVINHDASAIPLLASPFAPPSCRYPGLDTSSLSDFPFCRLFLFFARFVSAMPATTAETLSLVTKTVTVAPLVLLSVADHYGRTAKGTRKRVVGVLLGENTGQTVRVSNSFAGASCSHTPAHLDFLLLTNFIKYNSPIRGR